MATRRNQGPKLDWIALAVVVGIHLAALSAFHGALFSWTGVVLAVAGCYVFGTLGINLGFHRLLSHRSFKCPLWFEHLLAVLGVCCLEKTPGQFTATHRAHHQHADHDGDPHSPLATLFWGHMGWLFVEDPQFSNAATYDRYARDVFRDPFYMRLERNLLWLWLYGIHAVLFYVAGFAVGLLGSGGSLTAGLQFGSSLFVWGVLVRTVLVWHITWSINSIGHVWGYRNYETRGNSRNSLFIGLITNGDGWHNNHHADQRAASHGHKWWELDVTHITLLGLQLVGLAWDLVPIGAHPEMVTEKAA
jgi:stearoyl-CoA desaturase (delta-9 desaturase)